jgi:hypothetical protein
MELVLDGPLTKWKSKNENRFQLQLLLSRCGLMMDAAECCSLQLPSSRDDGGKKPT